MRQWWQAVQQKLFLLAPGHTAQQHILAPNVHAVATALPLCVHHSCLTRIIAHSRNPPPTPAMPRKARSSSESSSSSSSSSEASVAAPAPAPAPASQAKPPVRGNTGVHDVFISGISFDANADELRDLFASAGDIVEVRLATWQDSGRCRGTAHISFASAAGAAAAVGMTGIQHRNRRLDVAPAKSRADGGAVMSSRKPAGCTTLFVKNLPYETDESAVTAVFAKYGAVASVRLPRWHHTGKLKGNGFVQFKDTSGVDAAVAAASDLKLDGRWLRVDYDMVGPRAGFKTAEGRAWTKTNPDAASQLASAGRKRRR